MSGAGKKGPTVRVGGTLLFQAMAAVLIVSCFGSGLAGRGAARLLYGMGRAGVLPRRFFGRLSALGGNPTFNIWLTGVVALAGATLMSWERALELLNFGAFLSFMGVNAAAIREHFRHRRGERQRAYGLQRAISGSAPYATISSQVTIRFS